MTEIKLPRHNEGQISKVFPTKYSSKYKLSDPSDTLPKDNVRLKEVHMYQEEKWIREDDAYFDKRASALDFFDE